MPMLLSKMKSKFWASEYFLLYLWELHVTHYNFLRFVFSPHSCHLYMSLHVWYVHIESMTKELESNMCNFFIILSSCENLGNSNFKNSYSVEFLSSIQSFWGKTCLWYNQNLKKLWAIKYFFILLHVLITIFYEFVFRYIHVICTCLFICDMSIYKVWLKNWKIKNVQFFIILSSCENWVTQISKILIQLNSSHQYNHFEVQHAYVTIKIKEVVSNQIFLHFTACSHYNFLWFVFSYIHVICSCLFICDMSIYKVWLKN